MKGSELNGLEPRMALQEHHTQVILHGVSGHLGTESESRVAIMWRVSGGFIVRGSYELPV